MTAIIVPERKWKPRGVGMDGQRYQLWGVELVLTPPGGGVWWGGTGDGEEGDLYIGDVQAGVASLGE